MNKTSCAITFGRNAIAIKDDIVSITATDIQSFSDLDDLGMVVAFNQKPYATYEQDYWLLDGNYKFMPTTPHVGYMSASLTDENGDVVGSPPTLTIIFNSVHSTDNLILRFAQYTNDYASGITVAYYNSVDALIRTDNYSPMSTYFATGQAVANFKKIIITFTATVNLYRYFRLTGIDFDEAVLFSGTEVKAANVVEEINPLSTEISINTLDLTLFSADGDFSIVAPSGFYANLQFKEPLDVYEQINDDVIYIGRFYLDTWESRTENEATFEASDAIGLLDKPIFYGGFFVEFEAGDPISMEDLIERIMSITGLDYTLDPSLAAVELEGVLNVSSCREALQQVAFAAGAYITCARSNAIRILPIELASGLVAYDHTLTQTEKGIASPLTLKPLVTGVEISEHSFLSRDIPDTEFFNQTLAVGTHFIIPTFFPYDLDTTGTTATFTFDADYNNTPIFVAVVTVTGVLKLVAVTELGDTLKVISEYNGSLPVGTPQNVLVINDATLVTPANSAAVVSRVYDYHQQRYLQKTKLFASLVAPGDSVLINTQSGEQIKGIIEKINTDLARGYVSNVEIVGVIA